ncbi:MAG: type 4a pilus biogenesis protein PilO [Thiomargarita sp.]|nr:type 4a pilus biogenesis protein PilO [Thiomargarita sp.]
MKMEDFNNLDPQNFGNWPIPVKMVIIIVLCIAALFAGYWFDTQHQIIDLTKVKSEEKDLKKTFKKKQREAATLPQREEQLAQIESILKTLIKKLPGKAQVDELIRDITQTVLASGLKQELFEPQHKNEKSEKDVYVTLPIKLRVKGNYHAFGKFVSGLAAMNRIVTQHNISIKSFSKGSSKKNKLMLEMEMTAQIYRYLEKEEEGKKGKK